MAPVSDLTECVAGPGKVLFWAHGLSYHYDNLF